MATNNEVQETADAMQSHPAVGPRVSRERLEAAATELLEVWQEVQDAAEEKET